MLCRLLRGVWLALWDVLWAKVTGPTTIWVREDRDDATPVRRQHLG